MRRYLILALTCILSACAAVPKTAAQGVYLTEMHYAAALTVATKYRQLPRCMAAVSPLCSNPDVVAKLILADAAAYTAILAAQHVVRTPGFGSDAITSAFAAAEAAMQAYLDITSTLKVVAK